MNNTKKAKRVQITFEDDTFIYLEGKDAVEWQERVTSEGVMAWVHGMQNKPLNWKNGSKNRKEELLEALARGYTHPENAKKVLDEKLINAMYEELIK